MTWIAYLALGLVALLVLVFAMIGALYVTRGAPVRRVRTPGDDRLPGARDPAFRATVELLTKTELRPGHAVALFDCGDALYPRLWEDLRNAKRSITLQLYYCQPGRMADEFAAIVLERAAAGVRVLFLRDAFGSAPIPDEYWERLKRGGVRVAAFRPTRPWELHKVQHRSHIRVVTVDGKVGYTGGFGIDDKWYGDGRHPDQWRDTTVRFVGPAVLQLQATFAAGWAEATGELLAGDAFFPLDEAGEPEPARRAGEDAWAGLLHCAPTLGSTPAERFMALSIAGARERLWISNSYFVPDGHFCGMLVDAARRGADVRILTPDRNSDVKTTYWAGRTQFEALLGAGVRIFEYEAAMMHAKTLVADGAWVAVGTNNFDNRSMVFNDETVLMVHDGEVAAELERLFTQDVRYARELQLDTFRHRPTRERVVERAASLLARWL
ncbi:phospholipase D-like domain-containing protein [Roseisolibacter sp. H3M3-2]|uniref:phospholipase D-like domain-containing protein n=1 Tax=Roseisolibacter sp. H3M3-2 TaxID=3031323 RepID=UPI0023DC29A2|nr:phospholipase D-like domain-containing protein [Roseisolibacter sp. H3M3-2]MDF1503569.1 phospholipase D-like domain-containing protein [Roseisolibacter sp. H3M3-2]